MHSVDFAKLNVRIPWKVRFVVTDKSSFMKSIRQFLEKTFLFLFIGFFFFFLNFDSIWFVIVNSPECVVNVLLPQSASLLKLYDDLNEKPFVLHE